jgi:hypothetical protein
MALVFAALALGLLGGAHLYAARRLVVDPALPDPARSALLAALALLGASLVVLPFAERLLPRGAARALAFPPLLWMGALFLVTTLLAASDAALWLLGAGPAGDGPESALAAARVRAAGVAGLVALATAAGARAALRVPSVRRVELRLERWPRALDGFRIAQISDVHVGLLLGARFAAALVARVNALAADLVVVTGDLVDGSVARLADEVAPFAGLRGRHGVFFVTGNHDFYSGASSWAAHLGSLGLRVLRNERVVIGQGDAAFDLAGVDDHRGDWVRGSTEDLEAALAGRDPARPVVLLAHDPSTFRRAARLGVDLQLSGHTHGGQIWPFHHLVRLAVPFVAGLHRRGASQLYVSRGSGFWGPPLRLFAPAEIGEIVLRAAVL